jgi:hypothetical protein
MPAAGCGRHVRCGDAQRVGGRRPRLGQSGQLHTGAPLSLLSRSTTPVDAERAGPAGSSSSNPFAWRRARSPVARAPSPRARSQFGREDRSRRIAAPALAVASISTTTARCRAGPARDHEGLASVQRSAVRHSGVPRGVAGFCLSFSLKGRRPRARRTRMTGRSTRQG